MKNNTRVDKWDNLKCILILLVVIGHFANQYEKSSQCMRIISLFIYTFHMPLFIFLSGLLERQWSADSRFQWNKAAFYVLVGYLLKILIFFIKRSFGRHPNFYWLSDTGIPWYMFAMAAFYILAYLLRKADRRVVLAAGVFLACMAGYCNQINSFLSLSRIIVFFPFYYLGYIFLPEAVLQFSEKRWVKWTSAGVLGAGFFVCRHFIDRLYTYIRLFTGRNPYEEINGGDCGFSTRLMFFLITMLMGWAVLSLVPKKHFKLMSRIGKNTLQIYFWHRLVLYGIMYSGLARTIEDTFSTGWIAVYLMLAIFLTVVLSEDGFGAPLKLIRKFINRKLFVPDTAS